MTDSPDLRFDGFELRLGQRRLLSQGAPVALGARAFDVLAALAERRDRLVGKAELLDLVWPGLFVEENNLQVQVSALRRLLGAQAIATVPGRGYRFTAACEPIAIDAGRADATGRDARSDVDDPASRPSNLPATLPPLFGRADELAAIGALLETQRIVTVVGAGGIGKTSVARAVADAARGDFDDGVWLVELAPIADPSLVPGTVAGVLKVALRPDASFDDLARAIGTARLLLVIDNCEHLLDAVAALVVALHRDAPGVHVLATSQEALKVPGEQLCRLAALGVPASSDADGARAAGAVALFVARAQAAEPRFALTDANVAAVVDVCRHLDGIPLAIEMAAARVPLLGVDGVRARLGERLRLLRAGSRVALARHRTLRGALEWSHALLSADESAVFRRLGVFVGTFGLESAQHVAAGDDLDAWDVLDRLGALVDKSLVVVEPGDDARYRLLETTRAFALEKLREAGETGTTPRRHAEATLAVFEAVYAERFVAPEQARVDRCLPDLDNARAALDWSGGVDGDADIQVALAGAIAWLWAPAALRPEGLRRTEAAIDRVGVTTPPASEARLLSWWSTTVFPRAGSTELARASRAVALCRSVGDPQALYETLCREAIAYAGAYRVEAAETALDEAIGLFDRRWPPAMRASYLTGRGWLLDHQGRAEEHIAVSEELLSLMRSQNDRRKALRAMIGLEQGYAALGRIDRTVALGREMVDVLRQDRTLRNGNENLILVNLAIALAHAGELDEALACAREAHGPFERAGRVAELLDSFAFLAFRRGHLDDAARMLGRSRECFGPEQRREPVEQKLHDDVAHALEERLPATDLARLLGEGARMRDDDAVRLALRG